MKTCYATTQQRFYSNGGTTELCEGVAVGGGEAAAGNMKVAAGISSNLWRRFLCLLISTVGKMRNQVAAAQKQKS